MAMRVRELRLKVKGYMNGEKGPVLFKARVSVCVFLLDVFLEGRIGTRDMDIN
jgi:hypothetical protein